MGSGAETGCTVLVERSCDLREKVIALDGAGFLYPRCIYGLVTSRVTRNLKVFSQDFVLVSVIAAHVAIYSFPQKAFSVFLN